MKTYISHKTVQAAKIKAAERQADGRWHLMLDGNIPETTTIDEAGRFRITEEDMGYYVRYSDGYVSWSPTKPFEEGYAEADGNRHHEEKAAAMTGSAPHAGLMAEPTKASE